ncbi:survival motor neuron interacting protein 1-domain-containing protein [Phlyctochytrium arcticum]|nr:survival motor neuron interacting protein 1-domain-containing protein [Phlyctochytrium arcticum]
MSSNYNSRGRKDQKNWSQRDEDSIKRPALPLEGYGEDTNEGTASALQYLRMVRAEAEACPQTVRANVSNSTLTNVPQIPNTFDVRKEFFDRQESSSSTYTPSREWAEQFLSKFEALKSDLAVRREQYLAQPDAHQIQRPLMYHARQWKQFCYGTAAASEAQSPEGMDTKVQSGKRKPDDMEEAGDLESKRGKMQSSEPSSSVYPSEQGNVDGHDEGREPSPDLICQLEQGETISLLNYHIQWLGNDSITEVQGQWVFALLVRLDKLLHADEVALIRDLARKCRSIRNHMVASDAGDPRLASLNMIITIIAYSFGQKDLGDFTSDLLQ